MTRSSPPIPTAPNTGPPFEPLIKPWVKALAGGTFVGLLVGAALGAAIAAVKLDTKPPPPVSTAPIVVPSQFEPVPISSPGVFGPIVSGRGGVVDANDVTFEYPKNWQNMSRVVAAHLPHGRPAWNAVLGTGQSELAVVADYRGADPGTDAARGREALRMAQDVAGQLGSTFVDRPFGAGNGVLVAYGYSLVGAPVGTRPPWRVDTYVLFGPHDRYLVQCQTLGADPSDFSRGCAQIARTFRPVGPAIGATSPVDAARALFSAGKDGDAARAHLVANDLVAAEVAGAGWDPSLQPPSTCRPSDGAVGLLCGPSKPSLFSVEFEVSRTGNRWFVTGVFRCTAYGSERLCRSFSS